MEGIGARTDERAGVRTDSRDNYWGSVHSSNSEVTESVEVLRLTIPTGAL